MVIKVFLSGCILFCCGIAFAEISEQAARDFAVEAVNILRSDDGSEKLEAYINYAPGDSSNQRGWNLHVWYAKTVTDWNFDINKLTTDRIFIRDPDLDDPMHITVSDFTTERCLVPPEKIAVVYFSNRQDDIRAVFFMPLVTDHGKIKLCPMLEERTGIVSKKSVTEGPGTIVTNKNLCAVPGVEIIKVGDDEDSSGFGAADSGNPKWAFYSSPSPLQEIIAFALGERAWVTGFNYLPSGRFGVRCEMAAGEIGTANDKVIKAIADTLKLKIKKEEGFLWDGYRVTVPNPLPDCFEVTKNTDDAGQRHGPGDYDGLRLDQILSEALYNKPMQLLSTNDANRYDVKFPVWPEKYGEMAALQKLGFTIVPAKIPESTWVISPGK